MEVFVKEMADVLDIDAALLTPEFNLRDGAWDSLAIVSSIALIDEHFGVIADARALNNCVTFGDILALAKKAG